MTCSGFEVEAFGELGGEGGYGGFTGMCAPISDLYQQFCSVMATSRKTGSREKIIVCKVMVCSRIAECGDQDQENEPKNLRRRNRIHSVT